MEQINLGMFIFSFQCFIFKFNNIIILDKYDSIYLILKNLISPTEYTRGFGCKSAIMYVNICFYISRNRKTSIHRSL